MGQVGSIIVNNPEMDSFFSYHQNLFIKSLPFVSATIKSINTNIRKVPSASQENNQLYLCLSIFNLNFYQSNFANPISWCL